MTVVCKDCDDPGQRLTGGPMKPRPVVAGSGGRCATHHRERLKARKAAAHEARVLKVYNLPPGGYQRLLDFQGGVDPICLRATGKTKFLSTDHDHSCCSGATSCGTCVRGAICGPCNRMLGHGRDDPAFFLRAHAYLLNPPWARLRAAAVDG